MGLFKKKEDFDPRYGMRGYVCEPPTRFDAPLKDDGDPFVIDPEMIKSDRKKDDAGSVFFFGLPEKEKKDVLETEETSSSDAEFAGFISAGRIDEDDSSERSVEPEESESEPVYPEFDEVFENNFKEENNMDKAAMNTSELDYGRQIVVRYHFWYFGPNGRRTYTSKEDQSAAYQASQDKNVVRKYHWLDTGEELTAEEIYMYLP